MLDAGRSHQQRSGGKVKWSLLVMEPKLTWQELTKRKGGKEVGDLSVDQVFRNTRQAGRGACEVRIRSRLPSWGGKALCQI